MDIANQDEQQPPGSNLDEWGEYIRHKDDMVYIRNEDVFREIENHNPAVASLSTWLTSEDIDWDRAGVCVGNSPHLKQLDLIYTIVRFDIRSFCKGLAQNKSIESLNVDLCGPENLTIGVFDDLLPFFRDNTSLISVRLMFDFSVSVPAVLLALDSCRFLKSVIIAAFDYDVDMHLIRTICRKKPALHHVSILSGELDKNTCLEIKNLLSSDDCALKSLELCNVTFDDTAIALIATGLARNSSLKCFKFQAESFETMRTLLGFLESHRMHAMESFVLQCDDKYSNICPPVGAVVRQFPALKSLILSWPDPSVLKSIFAVLSSASTLTTLSVGGSIQNDDLLSRLGYFVANNSSLKELDLSYTRDISLSGWSNFFRAVETSTLEEIDLTNSIDTESLPMLSSCLASNPTLNRLNLSYCIISSSGWGRLASVLDSHAAIEDIDVTNCHDVAECLSDLMARTTKLKKVELSVVSVNEYSSIFRSLESAHCSIEELTIHYINEEVGTSVNQLTQIIVNSLQRNSSLRVLNTKFQWVDLEPNIEVTWSLYSSLLCDASSIEATYNSNHTLHSIRLPCTQLNQCPADVHSMLCMNQAPNKQLVARTKIIENHTLDDVKIVPSSLPIILSLLGNANIATRLSKVYGILRKVPDVIQKSEGVI